MKKINLGDKVKDPVTGFTGIVVARTEWLYGCTRINVQPAVDKDGKMVEINSFDEPQLIVLKEGAIKVEKKEEKETGGPMPAARQKQALH